VFCVSWPLHVANAEKAFLAAGFRAGPYDLQVAEQIAKLQSQSDKARAGAAEALGYLRAYAAADALAEAMGDFGDGRAVKPLIAAYPRFSRNLENRLKNPQICPSDDRFSGDNAQDRMHETPYSIAMALSRLPLDNADDRAALGRITPWLVANLPTSWDSGVFYDIKAAQLITAYLLEKAGTRQKVCDIAFDAAQHIGGKGPAITGRD